MSRRRALMFRKMSGSLGGYDDAEDTSGYGVLKLAAQDATSELFSIVVGLRTGEALLFAPSAVLAARKATEEGVLADIKRLDQGILKIRIRQRVTADSGQSIMAR